MIEIRNLHSCKFGGITLLSCFKPVDEVWNNLTAVLNFGVLKRIQTPQFIELHCGVSEQIKPLQPIGQAADFKFESKFEPLLTSAGHLAITLEGYSRRQSKVLTAKSTAKLLGPRSGTAWAGRTGEHKHRAFPSRRQSLLARLR